MGICCADRDEKREGRGDDAGERRGGGTEGRREREMRERRAISANTEVGSSVLREALR